MSFKLLANTHPMMSARFFAGRPSRSFVDLFSSQPGPNVLVLTSINSDFDEKANSLVFYNDPTHNEFVQSFRVNNFDLFK